MSLTRAQVRGLMGLVVGLTTGLGLLVWFGGDAVQREHAARADRFAIVRARMIADVVERAGRFGETARAAVARVAAADPAVVSVRVVRLDGAILEASTTAADHGDRAPPRRLERPEKWLYDAARELQAARATNREERSARKHEILLARDAGGRRRIAAPVGIAGVVAGIVHVDSVDQSAPRTVSFAAAALAFVAPILCFVLFRRPAGDRPGLVATLASVLLTGALGAFAWFSTETLIAARRQTAAAVQELVHQELAVARAGLPRDERPYDVAAWDVDQFLQPRGVVRRDGSLDRDALEREVTQSRPWALRSVAGSGLIALVLLLSIALGFASRLGGIVRRHRVAYIYATPAIGGLLLLVFLPFLYGLALSFTDANIYNSSAPVTDIFVGLRNFREILTDFTITRHTAAGRLFNYQNFYWTLGFTVVWTFANVAIGVGVGLALALALNTPGLALRPIYRVLLIVPWAVPNYITALIWRGMFHKQFGVVNQALLILGGDSISWFEHPLTAFIAIVATNGWLSFPFMMVISLGSLQSIPGELYEAARVDGATRWQQFKSITLPSLKPALVPAVILSVIWTFNMFNIPYLVSGGEPAHATEILITQAYKIAFEQYRYGYAAAYSTIIFAILLAYGTWQNRVSRATEAL